MAMFFMPISSDFNTAKLSEKLLGLSGAEIAFVVREAAYECLRKNIDINSLLE